MYDYSVWCGVRVEPHTESITISAKDLYWLSIEGGGNYLAEYKDSYYKILRDEVAKGYYGDTIELVYDKDCVGTFKLAEEVHKYYKNVNVHNGLRVKIIE